MRAERVWFRGLPPEGARVERLNLAFSRLPPALSGARLLFVSDVHAGFTFPELAQRRLIAQIEALEPDMILWGGDFAETRRGAEALFEKIGGLAPRLGMAGVVGNNDRRAFRGAMDGLCALAERAGVRLLINGEWTPAEGLTILGLDEDYYGTPDAATLAGGEGAWRILLSHSPVPLEALLGGAPVPELILCGHTHGGQMRLGGRTLYDLGFEGVRRGQRFFTVRGVLREEGAVVVVSAGLGSSKIPIRLYCPPEIQLITLAAP